MLDKYPNICYTNNTKRKEHPPMSELAFYILCLVGIIAWIIYKSMNAPQYIDWIREESERR